MTLGTKLVTSFLACGLIPLGIVAYVSYNTADNGMDTIEQKGSADLEQKAYNQLTALRDVKKKQIETYFGERKGDMGVLVDMVGTLRSEAFKKLVAVRDIKKIQIEDYFRNSLVDMEVFARSQDVATLYAKLVEYHNATHTKATGPYDITTTEYQQIWEKYGANVLQYFKDSGTYDIFMVCAAHGHVMYTCAKKSDLGTNLGHGPYKDSGLAELWAKVKRADGRAIVDFQQYAPSNGEPAAFAGAPIRDENGKAIGMMVVQLPLDQINAIMQTRAGLGETGETYLVGQDQLMRSDSFLDPKNHSVAASFADSSKGSVNTEASKAACAGETGADVMIDYNGSPVLSAFAPVTFEDLSWGLLAEIGVAEAFCPKDISGEYFFKKYTEKYGYYDLFLMNPDGYCFYSVAQKADYQTNFVDGKYSSSNLGKLTREVLSSNKFGFADFRPYAPSNGEPAAFVAQPVIHEGDIELVVALQLSQTAISDMMAAGSDVKNTLEAYLVGPEGYMRSNSDLNPEYTVAGCFKNNLKVESEGITEASMGNTGAMLVTDYMDSSVKLLSAYTPVDIFGTRWALACEIDESVALAAVVEMKKTASDAGSKLLTWTATLGAIAAVLVALISVMIARSISRPINRIVGGLNEGADQVNDAARQVSSASQQLAEGASEQASSLEETSSALEQMAAMTRTNAENAKEANNLSDQARSAAENGNATMGQLNEAMTGINESSGKISKIIKVIEEIAFQTNLLALNAAVEAARAGEHGKGFAVVADEVRNLAQRAAQAAQETTGLIDDSVNRAREGTTVAGEVGKALSAIVADVTKVTELVDGIAKASEEQAQGVDQVNTAVSQMDKITQQNASGAEESASASEELSAQATTVKSTVADLQALVDGNRGSGGSMSGGFQNTTPHKPRNMTKSPQSKKVPGHTPSGPSPSENFMKMKGDSDMADF